MSLIILKIGGSVITKKDSLSRPRKDEIDRISKEIASFATDRDVSDKLVLVHGAGSFGHPQALRYNLDEKFDVKGVYEIHSSVKELNSMVLDSLNNAGVSALPVHPLSSFILENGNIAGFSPETVNVMLKRGAVPVFHGDVVMDIIKGASVLSGDRIAPYLATLLGASRIGAGSNVDGVLDESGTVIKKITPTGFVDMKKHISGSSSTDVTGGMLGKVSEFIELSRVGISSRIFNASKKGMVSKFLYGEDVGTLIADK
ncbi:MAG: isopentenyl phosphate kinase [Candidatus Methanoperedens sp.]|jgi:isopentenyl phosphate kinase|nr:isopentenyl phosphate kinase [Candidatus Methanoperedens sp.]PKL54141.1 MAG: hypothetical protein CVV36_03270 [Candidatus Methanoperedenaceae archaeon HGW-Methanoperedenaceae-1]